MDSLKDFLGRAPNSAAFLTALGVEEGTKERRAVEAMERESVVLKDCTCGKEWETSIEDEGVTAENNAVGGQGGGLKTSIGGIAAAPMAVDGIAAAPMAAIVAAHTASLAKLAKTAAGSLRRKRAVAVEDHVHLTSGEVGFLIGDSITDVDEAVPGGGRFTGTVTHRVRGGNKTRGVFAANAVRIIGEERATVAAEAGAAAGKNAVDALLRKGVARERAQAIAAVTAARAAASTSDAARAVANDGDKTSILRATEDAMQAVAALQAKGLKAAASTLGVGVAALLGEVHAEGAKVREAAAEADAIMKQARRELGKRGGRGVSALPGGQKVLSP